MAKPEIFRSGRNYGTTFGRIPKNWDNPVIYSGRRSSSTASRSPFPPGEGIFLSSALQTPIKVIGFSKLVVKMVFVGFVPSIVGRGYDPAAHVPMREMYVLP